MVSVRRFHCPGELRSRKLCCASQKQNKMQQNKTKTQQRTNHIITSLGALWQRRTGQGSGDLFQQDEPCSREKYTSTWHRGGFAPVERNFFTRRMSPLCHKKDSVFLNPRKKDLEDPMAPSSIVSYTTILTWTWQWEVDCRQPRTDSAKETMPKYSHVIKYILPPVLSLLLALVSQFFSLY